MTARGDSKTNTAAVIVAASLAVAGGMAAGYGLSGRAGNADISWIWTGLGIGGMAGLFLLASLPWGGLGLLLGGGVIAALTGAILDQPAMIWAGIGAATTVGAASLIKFGWAISSALAD